MHKFLHSSALLLLLSLGACQAVPDDKNVEPEKESATATSTDQQLMQKWVTDSFQSNVVRLVPYEPAKVYGWRSVYDFKEGQIELFYHGPADEPLTAQGTWTLDENKVLTMHLGQKGTQRWRVLEVSATELRVEIL